MAEFRTNQLNVVCKKRKRLYNIMTARITWRIIVICFSCFRYVKITTTNINTTNVKKA